MWQYCKETRLIVSILMIFLDGIMIYFMPSFMNQLNYFYPMLTISFIPFLCKNKTNSYLIIFIVGFIYDLLYSNIFLYNALIFLFLAIINRPIIKCFNNNLLLFAFLAFLNILIYDSLSFLLVIISGYQDITIYDLFYKITHSILLNIVSVFVFYLLFKKHYFNT